MSNENYQRTPIKQKDSWKELLILIKGPSGSRGHEINKFLILFRWQKQHSFPTVWANAMARHFEQLLLHLLQGLRCQTPQISAMDYLTLACKSGLAKCVIPFEPTECVGNLYSQTPRPLSLCQLLVQCWHIKIYQLCNYRHLVAHDKEALASIP